MFTTSWDFTLESKETVLDELMPTFIEQEGEASMKVHNAAEEEKEQIFKNLEACNREFIGFLMTKLEKFLVEKPGTVSNLRLSYVCDHSCGHYWTIEGTYNDKPLTVYYTSDWYCEEDVELRVGPMHQTDLSGWAS